MKPLEKKTSFWLCSKSVTEPVHHFWDSDIDKLLVSNEPEKNDNEEIFTLRQRKLKYPITRDICFY